MQPRVETRNGRKVQVTESRSILTGDVAEFVEPVDDDENASESVQNREKNVHNYPVNHEGDDMNRFTTDPIQNDSCEDVPVLEAPTHMNKADGQQDGEKHEIELQNVEGDMVPVLEPPAYQPRKGR